MVQRRADTKPRAGPPFPMRIPIFHSTREKKGLLTWTSRAVAPLHLGDHAGKLDTITPTRKGSFWQRWATRGPPSLPNPFGGGLGRGLGSDTTA